MLEQWLCIDLSRHTGSIPAQVPCTKATSFVSYRCSVAAKDLFPGEVQEGGYRRFRRNSVLSFARRHAERPLLGNHARCAFQKNTKPVFPATAFRHGARNGRAYRVRHRLHFGTHPFSRQAANGAYLLASRFRLHPIWMLLRIKVISL